MKKTFKEGDSVILNLGNHQEEKAIIEYVYETKSKDNLMFYRAKLNNGDVYTINENDIIAYITYIRKVK